MTSTPHAHTDNLINKLNLVSINSPSLKSNWIECLHSSDYREVLRATTDIYKLVRIDSNRKTLGESVELMHAIIAGVLNNPKVSNIVQFGLASLYNISMELELRPNLMHAEILTLFPLLFQQINTNHQLYLAITFHNIFHSCPESRSILGDSNHICPFVNLLEDKNERILTIYIDCLLVCLNSICLEYLLQNTPFIKRLLQLLKENSYEKLKLNICRIIKEIAIRGNFGMIFNSMGAIQTLSNELLNDSRRVAVMSLFAIKSLSDQLDTSFNYDRLISILIRFVINQVDNEGEESPKRIEEKLLNCSMAVLVNVSCNNPRAKVYIINKNFIATLVKCLNLVKFKDLVESSCNLLKLLTCRCDAADRACRQLVDSSGMLKLIYVLNQFCSVGLASSARLKRSIIGVMVNLATQKVYCESLLKLKAIQIAAFTLSVAMSDIKSHGSLTDTTIGQSWIKNCHKLLETCVMFLYYMLSHEPAINLMINSPILINIFCELFISTSSDPTLSYVIFYLSQLSTTTEGIILIERSFKSAQMLQPSNKCSSLSDSQNICVHKLKSICDQIKSDSVLATPIRRLLNNLANTSVQIDFDYSHLTDSLSQQQDDKYSDTYYKAEINDKLDSPFCVSRFVIDFADNVRDI